MSKLHLVFFSIVQFSSRLTYKSVKSISERPSKNMFAHMIYPLLASVNCFDFHSGPNRQICYTLSVDCHWAKIIKNKKNIHALKILNFFKNFFFVLVIFLVELTLKLKWGTENFATHVENFKILKFNFKILQLLSMYNSLTQCLPWIMQTDWILQLIWFHKIFV